MTKPVITIHAVRRFVERVLGAPDLPANDDEALLFMHQVHGIDPEKIRTLLEGIVRQAVRLRAGAVRLAGARYVLSGNVLVTVVPIATSWRRRARIEREYD